MAKKPTKSDLEKGGKVAINKKKTAGLPTEDAKPVVGGVLASPAAYRAIATGKRFILTCAQNNTKLHKPFWANLHKMAKETGAQIMVARFSYNKNGWQKITKDHNDTGEGMWYAPEIEEYVQDDQVQIAPGLVFAAELDILPTAKDPLSGLDNYTGTNSVIVPHAKVHMRSYAGLLSAQPLRFGYTTGACTQRNYIERRAGQIAAYHHVYGAMFVEIDAEGVWFARQLIADNSGSFYDLGTCYGTPSAGQSVVNLGDIHAEKSDPVAFKVAMDMLRTLKPDAVAIHDLLDFEARNHHNLKDPFFWADQYFNGMNTVEANFRHAVTLLDEIRHNSPGARMLLVRSNHDQAFDRWLKEFDPKRDPANARFYHWHMYQRYRAIEQGLDMDSYADALLSAAMALKVDTDQWVHIKEDESYVIHDIEFGLHGHLGPNGSKGSPKSYRQLGRKINSGHTHSCGIIDGVWTAGVLANLNMGYNKGPSSWSQSHILTNPNGKRQMITQKGNKWRA